MKTKKFGFFFYLFDIWRQITKSYLSLFSFASYHVYCDIFHFCFLEAYYKIVTVCVT